MKGSFRGSRVFSDDISVRGNKFDRLKKEDKEADGQRNSSAKHYPDPPLMAAESSLLEPSSFSFSKSRYSSGMKNFHPYPQAAENSCPSALMGSLIREEGHIYSLATSGELLYTGSDSKNIRVWRNKKEYSGFKSNCGLVKAIVIADDKIFTGHQDGKIRVWKMPSNNESIHKKIGTLPTVNDYIRRSMKPRNYVEVRRHRNVLWIEHFDAISALSLSEDQAFLYSASWDKTFKVWRVSDFKCLESVKAHDDAINTLVSSFDGLVFTGSADGTVKVWRREMQGKGTKHFFSQTLLKQECAVTSMAVNEEATFIYCGSSDGFVNFWEREKSLSHGGVLRGHKLAVLCLTTAGNLVLSGSADMGISVWRREAEAEHTFLWTLTGHTGPVKCLAVEKDREAGAKEGQWIVYSGSLDKTVKMWKVSEESPATVPNEKSHRNEGCSSAATRTLVTALSFSRMISTT